MQYRIPSNWYSFIEFESSFRDVVGLNNREQNIPQLEIGFFFSWVRRNSMILRFYQCQLTILQEYFCSINHIWIWMDMVQIWQLRRHLFIHRVSSHISYLFNALIRNPKFNQKKKKCVMTYDSCMSRMSHMYIGISMGIISGYLYLKWQ